MSGCCPKAAAVAVKTGGDCESTCTKAGAVYAKTGECSKTKAATVTVKAGDPDGVATLDPLSRNYETNLRSMAKKLVAAHEGHQ